jgi:uroporphyrin-3 C-methyltransferase
VTPTPESAAAGPVTAKARHPSALGAAGWILLLLALAAAAVAAWSAWQTQARVHELESELVKRQQASSDLASEARISSRQAQDVAREAAAKVALLEARVAESAAQRSQVEELMQAVARARDDNVLSDLESLLRVAMQQSAITGSAEPLLATLRQADDRLARQAQPRLEAVRRAVGSDLERIKGAAVSDIGVLTSRLDEVLRLVDELPLLVRPQPPARQPAPPAPAASAAEPSGWAGRWREFGARVWGEMRGLVRVTSIEQPEAMLLAPQQAYFLRENLKLRLLNARLALLSRQYDAAQYDLQAAHTALERYFDRSARPVQTALTLVRQVTGQARLVTVPRPDATLAAIAAATAGR